MHILSQSVRFLQLQVCDLKTYSFLDKRPTKSFNLNH